MRVTRINALITTASYGQIVVFVYIMHIIYYLLILYVLFRPASFFLIIAILRVARITTRTLS